MIFGFEAYFNRTFPLLSFRSRLIVCSIRTKSSVDPNRNDVMKVLNVAEKNDAAKHIAGFLSNGTSRRREGLSKYNKIYEFTYSFRGTNAHMIMTSVSGHLLNYDFVGQYSKWYGCSPEELFEAPVTKQCPEDFVKIKETLEREVRSCDALLLWTDCDREGENIGFEIISVCTRIKRNIEIYRARFSEITKQSARNAMANLERPNKAISDAVDVRSELDLRIGASFTRFQTLRLKRVFPDVLGDSLISYGSCQFPTLGFVVERYKAVQNFIPEPFWKIKVSHTVDNLSVEFLWGRNRLFDRSFCQVLYERCLEKPLAKVEKVETKPKSKWRPVPLDTVELEKVASRKLKITAKETMTIAERLYAQGYISYPRTETNIFPREMNLTQLVESHTNDNRWGQFAARIMEQGANPRQGKKSDQAHPPIHPIKHTDGLGGNERKIYEYVVRHFLACLSKDAEGFETIVDIDINDEKFTASGLQIVALNYLEVYPYDKWNAKEIHIYQLGQTFEPTSIDLADGKTTAPNLLTEADLITLMEKHGIGTDATHAEHIDKIKQRIYVGIIDQIYFVPGELGIGLVEGYDSMGFEMSKPYLRAELENDLKRICDGTRDPKIVLREQIAKYREVFKKAVEQANKLDVSLSKYLQQQPNTVSNNMDAIVESLPQHVFKCTSCQSGMVIRERPSKTPFITCLGFPQCRAAVWLPEKVLEVKLAPNSCPRCGNDVRLLTFKFRPGSMAPYYTDVYTGCLAGCDAQFLDILEIRMNSRTDGGGTRTQNSSANTSGYSSGYSSFRGSVGGGGGGGSSSGGGGGDDNPNRTFMRPPIKRPPEQTTTYQPSRPVRSTDTSDVNDADVQCNCGMSARKLTVSKENHNKGRQFYACSKMRDDPNRCDFFLWADTTAATGGDQSTHLNVPGSSRPSSYSNYNSGGGGGGAASNRPNWPGSSQFRATNKFPGSRKNANETRTTRKCGNCRQVGHTRKNCPLIAAAAANSDSE